MEKKDKKLSILKTRRIRIFLIVTIVCVIAGVSFFVYPSIINYFSSIQQERILEEWEMAVRV